MFCLHVKHDLYLFADLDNIISLDYLYLVWEEEDRLKVLQIKVIQITEKIHDLLIAKANFVIRVTVQVNLDINSVKVSNVLL